MDIQKKPLSPKVTIQVKVVAFDVYKCHCKGNEKSGEYFFNQLMKDRVSNAH